MVSSLRQAMSNAGFNIYLIGDEYYALNPPDPARIANWDAIFGYNTYVGYAGYSDSNGFLAFHSAGRGEGIPPEGFSPRAIARIHSVCPCRASEHIPVNRGAVGRKVAWSGPD
jgi:hypothetical protein